MASLNKLLESLIHAILEQEFLTKASQPIEFKFQEQSTDKTDSLGRGWIVHKLEAFVDGENVGYIKVSYIPKARFDKEYSTILQYLEKIEGRHLQLPSKVDTQSEYTSNVFDTLPPKVQLYALEKMSGVYQPEPVVDDKDFAKRKKQALKTINQKYGKKFKEFQEFHVDKPLVDYILVNDNAQRQRIGAALYEKAARILAEKGLSLYASGLQSDSAKASWEWLKQNKGANIGQVQHGERTRTFLSYV